MTTVLERPDFDRARGAPCSIDEDLWRRVRHELEGDPASAAAFGALDGVRAARDGIPIVDELAADGAAWALVAALCHPVEDVQVAALRALARIGDAAQLPRIASYAGSLVGPIVGSEGATLRTILRDEAAQTLNALGAGDIAIDWDDLTDASNALGRLASGGGSAPPSDRSRTSGPAGGIDHAS